MIRELCFFYSFVVFCNLLCVALPSNVGMSACSLDCFFKIYSQFLNTCIICNNVEDTVLYKTDVLLSVME